MAKMLEILRETGKMKARVDELRKQPTDPNHGTAVGGANG